MLFADDNSKLIFNVARAEKSLATPVFTHPELTHLSLDELLLNVLSGFFPVLNETRKPSYFFTFSKNFDVIKIFELFFALRMNRGEKDGYEMIKVKEGKNKTKIFKSKQNFFLSFMMFGNVKLHVRCFDSIDFSH